MISKLGIHQFQPDKVWKWKSLEAKIARILALNDYQEIRLSVLQDYQLLQQGIAALPPDDTALPNAESIVNPMDSTGKSSPLALRPEATISILHHSAQHIQEREVQRFYYLSPMFRKDAQGQVYEYQQLGVELLGSDSVKSDNEVISLGLRLLHGLGLKNAKLELNHFGCDNCRPEYQKELKSYLDAQDNALCKNCLQMLKNQALKPEECEAEECQQIWLKMPKSVDYLCPKCQANLLRIKTVQANLTHAYTLQPLLFKSFSYYNGTVFNFVLPRPEGNLVLGGGGRYDHLSRAITGKKIPAVGFYLNIDSIFELLDSRELFGFPDKGFSVYISSQSEDLEMMMLQIAQELQENRIKTVLGVDKNSSETEALLAQKCACELMIIIREENVREGKVLLRYMKREHQDYVGLSNIVNEILLARKSLNKD